MNIKSQLICNICKIILKEPVNLPCTSVVCGEHLRDSTVKNGQITCLKCEKNFDVPNKGFAPNLEVGSFLANDSYLSSEEKSIKQAIQDLLLKLERLQEDAKLKQVDIEMASFMHFTEIRRQIDIQREELKLQIDQVAFRLINQVKTRELFYKIKLKRTISDLIRTNAQNMRQRVAHEFRNPNLTLENVKTMHTYHKSLTDDFEVKLSEFVALGDEIKTIGFKSGKEYEDESFGRLMSNKLFACTLNNTIVLRDLVLNQYVATLRGHSEGVRRLEKIDQNRFASGSSMGIIKIWDSHTFVCLKTLGAHRLAVMSLRSLTSSRLASGSLREIKIWDIERGICIRTLNAHASWVQDLVCLPSYSGN